MIVLLDTGVAGLLAHPAPKSEVESWLVGLIQRGRSVLLPEIVDYELRRELLRARLATSLHALNSLPDLGCGYLPLGTAAMRAAAEFWAQLRQGGEATAGDRELDADCILAGQSRALSDAEVRDVVVATSNVRHLERMVVARHWQDVS